MSKSFKKLHQILPKHLKVLDSKSHRMIHHIYPDNSAEEVKINHQVPQGFRAKLAYYSVKTVRSSFDFVTGYNTGKMTQKKWVNRCIFLETVAGVPGMVGGMCRHLQSLRLMKRDHGWIKHLLEQSDNQRFHLLIFINFKNPGTLMRILILLAQGIFMNTFFLTYLIKPKFCHKFVGYLQEEAVRTYTHMLENIDNPQGVLHHWNKIPAPQQAIAYYHLKPDATYRDVVLSIRADEACHRETNHFLSEVSRDYNLDEQKVQVYNQDPISSVKEGFSFQNFKDSKSNDKTF